jgi:uncharacterized protein YndB with AHSA1/START domain
MTHVIEKKTVLAASRARVWRAITDSAEYGLWFGVKFDGPFSPGEITSGVITGTTVDEEVAAAQKPYVGTRFEVTVEDMIPESVFSFWWHPVPAEPGSEASSEPATLVKFVLEEVDAGVLLTITESGFDRISLEKRAQVFNSNSQGWEIQAGLIAKYLVHAP